MNDQVSRKELDIRFSQFQKFLTAKGLEKPCPECGVNHWSVNRSQYDDSDDPIMQVGEIKGLGTDRVLPIHTLSCDNCGYIKAYSALVVTDWVKDNG